MIMPHSGSINANIRYGKKDDLPAVLELIKELAVFEKEPLAVINTVQEMEKDGFGKDPVFKKAIRQYQHRRQERCLQHKPVQCAGNSESDGPCRSHG